MDIQLLACCRPSSSPVKKPSLLKAHQFEEDPFDESSEGSEGLGLCVSSLSPLIGTVAETSEEKYRLLDQRDRVMRQGKGLVLAEVVFSGAVREGVTLAWGAPLLLGLGACDVYVWSLLLSGLLRLSVDLE